MAGLLFDAGLGFCFFGAAGFWLCCCGFFGGSFCGGMIGFQRLFGGDTVIILYAANSRNKNINVRRYNNTGDESQ